MTDDLLTTSHIGLLQTHLASEPTDPAPAPVHDQEARPVRPVAETPETVTAELVPVAPGGSLRGIINAISGTLQPDGAVLGHCPAHTDTDPSLVITVRRGDKHPILMHCRAGCDNREVLRALGVDRFRDIKIDVDESELPSAPEPEPWTADDYAALRASVDAAAAAITDEARAYARDRFGLTDADIDRLKLGYIDHLGPRLIVPWFHPDGTMYAQGRTLNDHRVRWAGALNPGGSAKRTPVKIGRIDPEGTPAGVIICEGPSDGLTAVSLGWSAIIVPGAGQAANAESLRAIARCIRDGETVRVSQDGDAPGAKFAANVITGLRGLGITVHAIEHPAGADLAVTRNVGAVVPFRWREAYKEYATDKEAARVTLDWIRSQGYDVAWATDAKRYAIWDGSRWAWDPDGARLRSQFTTRVGDAIRSALARLHLDGEVDRDEFDRMGKVAAYADSAKLLSFVPDAPAGIKALAHQVEAGEFDTNPDILGVANGVVDLRTGELRPARPEDRVTRHLAVAYNPHATAPRWERFLSQVLIDESGRPDPELAAYTQRLFGYAATGHTKEQKFIVAHGSGSNGKNTMIDTIGHVLDPVRETSNFDTFVDTGTRGGSAPSPDVARLAGARLVIASEGEEGAVLSEGRVKSLTGDDRITARFLNSNPFTFRPSFLIVLVANHRPHVRGTDNGVWRRVQLVNFRAEFKGSDVDPDLPDKLREESEGILRWIIDGAREWYRVGLNPPASITDAVAEYRESEDRLKEFLDAVVEPLPAGADDPGIQARKLYRAYAAWTDEIGDRARMSERTFTNRLKDRSDLRVGKKYKTWHVFGVRPIVGQTYLEHVSHALK